MGVRDECIHVHENVCMSCLLLSLEGRARAGVEGGRLVWLAATQHQPHPIDCPTDPIASQGPLCV